MKIFISWSGAKSREAAELLHTWIGSVLQTSQPWMSSRQIDKGSQWFQEIADQLAETSVGLVVLTSENKEKPWIHYEAGALAKGLSTSRVATFLVDLEPADVDDPLAQLNHTRPNREEMAQLIEMLNRHLALPLSESRLGDIFDTYWPRFETKFKELKDRTAKNSKQSKPKKTGDEAPEGVRIMQEVLETARRIERAMVGIAPQGTENLSRTPVASSLSQLLASFPQSIKSKSGKSSWSRRRWSR
jgi:hypothetical protein